jgi:hypothetical protein
MCGRLVATDLREYPIDQLSTGIYAHHNARVHDNKELVTGFRTKYWCSQDEEQKKKAKPSQKPDAKHRDNLGMTRFKCGSRLTISCNSGGDKIAVECTLHISLVHHEQHVHYYDVTMPPGAAVMVRENVEWATPADLVTKVQSMYPSVTRAQIHTAWSRMSEMFWRREDKQLPSALKLLTEFPDDVDIFHPVGVPEGVEILCFGMKKIAGPLKGKIVEVALDATCELNSLPRPSPMTHRHTDNTNSSHLELYCMLAEHDNAGFPLTYCLLSTASSIELGKRKLALTAWAKCVRDTYAVYPEFAHVDKDMAEIATLKALWVLKVVLCWWHLRCAVRQRLAAAKLLTTPYDGPRARWEFSFIDADSFKPRVRPDRREYEGGFLEEQEVTPPTKTLNPSWLTVRLPNPTPLGNTQLIRSEPVVSPVHELYSEPRLILHIPPLSKIAVTTRGNEADSDVEMTEVDKGEEREWRVFCPPELRSHVVDMMERHYCAHPSISGYSHPSPEGIKYWAVEQIYQYCLKHDLPELWAYLWENWYRAGRWELWACSAHPTIPRLKTTMICESQ